MRMWSSREAVGFGGCRPAAKVTTDRSRSALRGTRCGSRRVRSPRNASPTAGGIPPEMEFKAEVLGRWADPVEVALRGMIEQTCGAPGSNR